MTRGRAMAGHAHCALFYRDESDYVEGVSQFLEPAVEQREPIAVAVPAGSAEPIAERLQDAGASYELLDMAELGRNPARIIPAVEAMLPTHGGRTLHYVGEPIWPGRAAEEVREAVRHEALVNLAWPQAPIRALCAHDQTNLEPDVLLDAQRTHPFLISDGYQRPSRMFGATKVLAFGAQALEPAPDSALRLSFGPGNLAPVRRAVAERAGGLSARRRSDLILAVSELATNAVRHGGGSGALRIWDQDGQVVCQVEDRGHLGDPLAGRRAPRLEEPGGLGLWTVNQVCDLVEIRTGLPGTIVRIHMAR